MRTDPFALERDRMVAEQIERRGLRDVRLLQALRRVPRHLFVPPDQRPFAYEDRPLAIGHGQTISQPYIVALMTDLLQLTGGETVLEVGAGSGYQAAVLGCLAARVHTLEIIPELARAAQQALGQVGLDNVQVHPADGSLGWPEAAPYAAILVAASAPSAPRPLLDQLAEGGRLVLPVGPPGGLQWLERWTRRGQDWQRESLLAVAFVPLRGAHGWDRQA